MKYAIIQDGIVVNLAESEPDFAAQQGWIAAPDYVNNKMLSIGWIYNGTAFLPPPETQQE
jgi:hypothetical protein